jgi:hypothetical protein
MPPAASASAVRIRMTEPDLAIAGCAQWSVEQEIAPAVARSGHPAGLFLHWLGQNKERVKGQNVKTVCEWYAPKVSAVLPVPQRTVAGLPESVVVERRADAEKRQREQRRQHQEQIDREREAAGKGAQA